MENNFYKVIDTKAIKYSDTYKVSNNIIDGKLKDSIKRFGIISPVILQNFNSYFEIISGHNRIQLAYKYGIKKIECIIFNKFDLDYFIKLIITRVHENRIGPVGKVKAFEILKSNYEDESLHEILSIPDYLSDDLNFNENILKLPLGLKNYLDFKNINYKVIKKLLALPEDFKIFICSWITEVIFRNNIFKEIVSNLYDIYKRDGVSKQILKISFPESDKTQKEKLLYNEIKKIRYPLYHTIKNNTDKLIKGFKNNNINIKFPEYFEDNFLDLSFRVYKNRTDIDKIKKNIDKEKIDKLLGFL